jgi:hypothetical protein
MLPKKNLMMQRRQFRDRIARKQREIIARHKRAGPPPPEASTLSQGPPSSAAVSRWLVTPERGPGTEPHSTGGTPPPPAVGGMSSVPASDPGKPPSPSAPPSASWGARGPGLRRGPTIPPVQYPQGPPATSLREVLVDQSAEFVADIYAWRRGVAGRRIMRRRIERYLEALPEAELQRARSLEELPGIHSLGRQPWHPAGPPPAPAAPASVPPASLVVPAPEPAPAAVQVTPPRGRDVAPQTVATPNAAGSRWLLSSGNDEHVDTPVGESRVASVSEPPDASVSTAPSMTESDLLDAPEPQVDAPDTQTDEHDTQTEPRDSVRSGSAGRLRWSRRPRQDNDAAVTPDEAGPSQTTEELSAVEVAETTLEPDLATAEASEPVGEELLSEPVAEPVGEDLLLSEPVADVVGEDLLLSEPVAEPVGEDLLLSEPVAEPVGEDLLLSEPVAEPVGEDSLLSEPVAEPVGEDSLLSEPEAEVVGEDAVPETEAPTEEPEDPVGRMSDPVEPNSLKSQWFASGAEDRNRASERPASERPRFGEEAADRWLPPKTTQSDAHGGSSDAGRQAEDPTSASQRRIPETSRWLDIARG